MIEIYQFDPASFENELIEAYGDFVNPAYAKKLAAGEVGKIRSGSKASVESKWRHYVHVATVDTDDLDEAFDLTDFWNPHDPYDDTPDRVEKKAPMYSTSVGDVFQTPDGIYHMVNNTVQTQVGFTLVRGQ